MFKIAVFVSGSGSNLQALLEVLATPKGSQGEIVLVLSSRAQAFALERARLAGLKTAICQRSAYISQSDFDQALLAELIPVQANLLVLAGFTCKLGAKFLAECACPVINIHPALIPKYCGQGYYGLVPHQAALDAGDLRAGATVHYVNEVYDAGAIIKQESLLIRADDDALSLQKRVLEEIEHKILPEVVLEMASRYNEKEGR